MLGNTLMGMILIRSLRDEVNKMTLLDVLNTYCGDVVKVTLSDNPDDFPVVSINVTNVVTCTPCKYEEFFTEDFLSSEVHLMDSKTDTLYVSIYKDKE